MKDTDFDYGFHLAAMVGGRLMIENNPLAVADDLVHRRRILGRWAKERTTEEDRLFLVPARPIRSSCKRHSKDYVLLKEDMISFESNIGMPDMSYGWAKLTCEYLAKLAYTRHGLNSICYRRLRLWRGPG